MMEELEELVEEVLDARAMLLEILEPARSPIAAEQASIGKTGKPLKNPRQRCARCGKTKNARSRGFGRRCRACRSACLVYDAPVADSVAALLQEHPTLEQEMQTARFRAYELVDHLQVRAHHDAGWAMDRLRSAKLFVEADDRS